MLKINFCWGISQTWYPRPVTDPRSHWEPQLIWDSSNVWWMGQRPITKNSRKNPVERSMDYSSDCLCVHIYPYLLVVPLLSDCCFSFSLLLLLVACFTRPDFSTRAFLLPERNKVTVPSTLNGLCQAKMCLRACPKCRFRFIPHSTVSYWHLLSTDKFYSVQWFC